MFILLKKSEIRIIKYKIFVWNFVIQSCLKDTLDADGNATAVVVMNAGAPEAKEDAAPADDKKDDASKDDSEAAETTDDSADAE